MWPFHERRENKIIWGDPAAELRRQQESLDRFDNLVRAIATIFRWR